MTDAQRLAFACPPGQGEWDDIDLGLLDPADEDERRILIEAEHPEFREASEDDVDEIHLGGRVVSPNLHIAMHEIVANQLWADEPPEVWQTAQRLTAAGTTATRCSTCWVRSWPGRCGGRWRVTHTTSNG